MTRKKTMVILVGVGALTALVLVFLQMHSRARDRWYTSSCANHFIQLSFALQGIANEHLELILPATSDTRSALSGIFTAGGRTYFGLENLNGYGCACPESYAADGGIGYVYIGDGLKIGDVVNKNILILFCPGENHRRSSEHCHAFDARDGICVHSNAEMLALLEDAFNRGRVGNVPYSKRAMQLLESEIAKRKPQS